MREKSKSRPGGGETPRSDCCMSRRRFLQAGGGTALTLLLSTVPGFSAVGEGSLRAVGYPRRKIGRLSALKTGHPVPFNYPHRHSNCSCFLVKLGAEAGGGIGPEKDVVAFSSLCPHMGGSLKDLYKGRYKAVGPCKKHLSVFDLRKHGMVVTGHSTQGLPQVVLETEGDEIFATGVMGLLFGFHDNKVSPK